MLQQETRKEVVMHVVEVVLLAVKCAESTFVLWGKTHLLIFQYHHGCGACRGCAHTRTAKWVFLCVVVSRRMRWG